MEIQPQNSDEVSSKLAQSKRALAILEEIKRIALEEKKAKEDQSIKDSSHQMTYSSSFKA